MFLLYCLKNNIKIVPCPFHFQYQIDNHLYVYYPDFYLPDQDLIIELKGRSKYYDAERVNRKQQAVYGHNYKIIRDAEINKFYIP